MNIYIHIHVCIHIDRDVIRLHAMDYVMLYCAMLCTLCYAMYISQSFCAYQQSNLKQHRVHSCNEIIKRVQALWRVTVVFRSLVHQSSVCERASPSLKLLAETQ